ncbi:MAG: ABC transporter ATP-binding protein [Proteobacteria bacterium]|nr:ABC transporter ATP-binding protein [Pseudomonadota bacterium]
MASSEPVLSAHHLTKHFRQGETTVAALRDVSLEVARGELLGIVGPSGSGKSTLLSILGLSESPSAGELCISGVRIPFEKGEAGCAAIRRSRIGFVFQHFNLISSLNAAENIELPLLLNGASRAEAQERARVLLTKVGLSNKEVRFPHQLSGGEMQRVAVCRAVAHAPAVILADEPTGSLDAQAGQLVMDLLKELAGEGHTIVMATHSERAMGYCSRILRLEDGCLSA